MNTFHGCELINWTKILDAFFFFNPNSLHHNHIFNCAFSLSSGINLAPKPKFRIRHVIPPVSHETSRMTSPTEQIKFGTKTAFWTNRRRFLSVGAELYQRRNPLFKDGLTPRGKKNNGLSHLRYTTVLCKYFLACDELYVKTCFTLTFSSRVEFVQTINGNVCNF